MGDFPNFLTISDLYLNKQVEKMGDFLSNLVAFSQYLNKQESLKGFPPYSTTLFYLLLFDLTNCQTGQTSQPKVALQCLALAECLS